MSFQRSDQRNFKTYFLPTVLKCIYTSYFASQNAANVMFSVDVLRKDRENESDALSF